MRVNKSLLFAAMVSASSSSMGNVGEEVRWGNAPKSHFSMSERYEGERRQPIHTNSAVALEEDNAKCYNNCAPCCCLLEALYEYASNAAPVWPVWYQYDIPPYFPYF